MNNPRHRGAAQIGALLGAVVRPALAARGLGQASLLAHWPDIVGASVARYAQPERLQWPARGDKHDPFRSHERATLILRIDGAFGIEAAHMSNTIIARVNAHLGWRCVERIAFRQGPLAPPRKAPAATTPPSAGSLTRAREIGAAVKDDDLREALAQLGARVLDAGPRS